MAATIITAAKIITPRERVEDASGLSGLEVAVLSDWVEVVLVEVFEVVETVEVLEDAVVEVVDVTLTLDDGVAVAVDVKTVVAVVVTVTVAVAPPDDCRGLTPTDRRRRTKTPERISRRTQGVPIVFVMNFCAVASAGLQLVPSPLSPEDGSAGFRTNMRLRRCGFVGRG